jgi:hypothetical protein
MKQIDPAEISGLIDGELDPARAAEVREAIEKNPVLRMEFEQLSKLNAACLKAGVQASFQAKVDLPSTADDLTHKLGKPLALTILLLIYFMPKAINMFFIGIVVHAAVLAVVLWVIWRLCVQTAGTLRLERTNYGSMRSFMR